MWRECAWLFLMCVCSSVHSQVPGPWGCPKVPVKSNFNLQKYVGKWYEIERYFPVLFEIGGKCGQAEYDPLPNKRINVTNKGFSILSQKITMIEGYASAPNASEPAKLRVVFPSASAFAAGPYWVLDTDYSSYSIVYSCQSLDGIAHSDIVWILARERFPTDSLIDAARKTIKSFGLRTLFLHKTDQNNCPF